MRAVGWPADRIGVALGVAWGEAHTPVDYPVYGENAVWADAIGDLDRMGVNPRTLANWGPSVSCFQVRTLRNPDVFSPADRWRRAWPLHASVYYAAHAVLVISKNGTDWSPWSAFRSGVYLEHVGRDLPLVWGHPDAERWSA